jgi:hypothetical protein
MVDDAMKAFYSELEIRRLHFASFVIEKLRDEIRLIGTWNYGGYFDGKELGVLHLTWIGGRWLWEYVNIDRHSESYIDEFLMKEENINS